MPTVAVPTGIRIGYEVVGRGDPLLLIPGTGQGGRLWSLQVPAYSPRYTCILLDNRGVGASDVPDDGYNMRQMAEDASAICRML
jgi:pimeloyl-ACP methyl ester carboxylesterase